MVVQENERLREREFVYFKEIEELLKLYEVFVDKEIKFYGFI